MTNILEHGQMYNQKVAEREGSKEREEISAAFSFLRSKDYDGAHRLFNYLLKQNEHDYWANYGMSKVLAKKCLNEDIYCELAYDYILLTKSLSEKHSMELDNLLSSMPHGL